MPQGRRKFTDEFKSQMVQLFEGGKSRSPFFGNTIWLHLLLTVGFQQSQRSGSFSEKANRSSEENELIALRKENQRLKMENDILKQAALIMDRK